jgi:translocator protein
MSQPTPSPNLLTESVAPWQPSVIRQAVWFIGIMSVCFAVAGLGAAATATSVNGWYQTLVKPSWNPPDWIFGPVWTALYLLMAVSAWLVWRQQGWPTARPALIWFGIQLSLNLLWSVVFFGMQRPGLAVVEMVLLWISIVATCLAFRASSYTAAMLQVPYLAWTSFAAVLNFTLWRMNS